MPVETLLTERRSAKLRLLRQKGLSYTNMLVAKGHESVYISCLEDCPFQPMPQCHGEAHLNHNESRVSTILTCQVHVPFFYRFLVGGGTQLAVVCTVFFPSFISEIQQNASVIIWLYLWICLSGESFKNNPHRFHTEPLLCAAVETDKPLWSAIWQKVVKQAEVKIGHVIAGTHSLYMGHPSFLSPQHECEAYKWQTNQN